MVKQPPLLPWQILFAAYACGAFALARPVAAGAAVALVAGLALAWRLRQPGLVYILAAFGAGYGAAWLAFSPPPPVPDWMADRQKAALSATVETVTGAPDGRLRLLLDQTDFTLKNGESGRLPGKLAFTWINPLFPVEPGDRLTVTARVLPAGGYANPGLVDYAFHWALQGVYYRGYAAGDQGGLAIVQKADRLSNRLRGRIRDLILGQDAAFPAPPPSVDAPLAAAVDAPPAAALDADPEKPLPDDPAARKDAPDLDAPESAPREAALAAAPAPDQGRAMVLALITGDRSRISDQSRELMSRAGLAHSLALSGLHLGFAAALGWLLARLVGRVRPEAYLRLSRPKMAVILAAPFVAGYVWLGGATPSLLRAALMFGCWGTLILVGRNRILLDGLFFALAVILLASPLSVFDVRLQLSAMAVAGIAAFWPPGKSLFGHLPLRGRLRAVAGAFLGLVWTSLSAQVGVYPIVAASFGEAGASLWLNLLANALWLPVLGFAVLPLAAAGLFASALPGLFPAGQACLALADGLCRGLLTVLAQLDAKGWLDLVLLQRPEWPQVLGYYLLLFLAAAWRPGALSRDLACILAGLALLLAPGALRFADSLGDGASLTLLDVGQGQAVLIEAPPGNRVLVDGGGVFGSFDLGRRVVAPALTVNRPPELSRIILTHPHADHFKGLAFPLARFAVASLAGNGALPEGEEGRPFREAVHASGLPMAPLRAGDVLDLGRGYRLEVLAPAPDVPEEELSENNGSLVLRLTFRGRGLALLGGDAENASLREIVDSGRDIAADALLLPHHGSSSSRNMRFYKAVSPKVALVSCGPYNAFRYPSKKVAESMERLRLPLFMTSRDGAIRVVWEEPDNPDAAPVIETYAWDDAPAILRKKPPAAPPLSATAREPRKKARDKTPAPTDEGETP